MIRCQFRHIAIIVEWYPICLSYHQSQNQDYSWTIYVFRFNFETFIVKDFTMHQGKRTLNYDSETFADLQFHSICKVLCNFQLLPPTYLLVSVLNISWTYCPYEIFFKLCPVAMQDCESGILIWIICIILRGENSIHSRYHMACSTPYK